MSHGAEVFWLLTDPFAERPDVRFLIRTPPARAAMRQLQDALTGRPGWVVLLGEPGVGKTVLAQLVAESWDDEGPLGLIHDAGADYGDLSEQIHEKLHAVAGGSLTVEALRVADRAGRRPVLLLDGAEALSEQTVQELEANYSATDEDGAPRLLIDMVAIVEGAPQEGPPDWARARGTPVIPLEPLAADDVAEYVRRRIRIAAGGEREIFDDGALDEVVRRTGGLPDAINRVCALALDRVAETGASRVGAEDVLAAANTIGLLAPAVHHAIEDEAATPEVETFESPPPAETPEQHDTVDPYAPHDAVESTRLEDDPFAHQGAGAPDPEPVRDTGHETDLETDLDGDLAGFGDLGDGFDDLLADDSRDALEERLEAQLEDPLDLEEEIAEYVGRGAASDPPRDAAPTTEVPNAPATPPTPEHTSLPAPSIATRDTAPQPDRPTRTEPPALAPPPWRPEPSAPTRERPRPIRRRTDERPRARRSAWVVAAAGVGGAVIGALLTLAIAGRWLDDGPTPARERLPDVSAAPPERLPDPTTDVADTPDLPLTGVPPVAPDPAPEADVSARRAEQRTETADTPTVDRAEAPQVPTPPDEAIGFVPSREVRSGPPDTALDGSDSDFASASVSTTAALPPVGAPPPPDSLADLIGGPGDGRVALPVDQGGPTLERAFGQLIPARAALSIEIEDLRTGAPVVIERLELAHDEIDGRPHTLGSVAGEGDRRAARVLDEGEDPTGGRARVFWPEDRVIRTVAADDPLAGTGFHFADVRPRRAGEFEVTAFEGDELDGRPIFVVTAVPLGSPAHDRVVAVIAESDERILEMRWYEDGVEAPVRRLVFPAWAPVGATPGGRVAEWSLYGPSGRAVARARVEIAALPEDVGPELFTFSRLSSPDFSVPRR